MPSFKAPVRVSLDLTYICDLRCIHCRTNTGEIPAPILKRMMSTETMKRLIHDLDEMQTYEITFTGGEPTLHPAFWELAALARELRYASITLITNAAAYDKAFIDRLVETGIRSVRVSVDGTRETFLEVRKKDVFERVIDNALYMQDRFPNFKLLTTVMTTNQRNVFELADYLRARGFQRQDLILVRAHGRGGRNALTLDEAAVHDVQLKVADFQARIGAQDFDLRFNAPYLNPEEDSDPVFDVVMYPYLVKNASIAISATGDVTMSRLYSPLPIGNVKQKSIKEIWEDGKKQLIEESDNFSQEKLREIFWSFDTQENEKPKKVSLPALLDRQIFDGHEVS